ncbi:MAG: DUF6171 family protein [Clostridia bacterium]|nr:DUF6171 family protein [Clostridia bacterium]
MNQRPCKKCLLSEISSKDYHEIVENGLNNLKAKDLTDDTNRLKRLSICKECDKLNTGTCFACGCYVEIRAALKSGKCPEHKWN